MLRLIADALVILLFMVTSVAGMLVMEAMSTGGVLLVGAVIWMTKVHHVLRVMRRLDCQ